MTKLKRVERKKVTLLRQGQKERSIKMSNFKTLSTNEAQMIDGGFIVTTILVIAKVTKVAKVSKGAFFAGAAVDAGIVVGAAATIRW